MKKVCIFTNYLDYLKSFSPLILANDQIKALKKNGYKPVVIVTEGFVAPKDSYFNHAELRYIPNVTRSEDSRNDPEFDSDIEMLEKTIEKHLEDIDVVITHDMLYLPDYLKYNLACRKIADKRPALKWLHWLHSATPPTELARERQILTDKYHEMIKPFPNSTIVYPNEYDIPRVAKAFEVEEKDVKCVPHPTDYPTFMKFDDITKKLVEEKKLLQSDIISVYPLRLDRGKQPHINIEIMAEIKELGFSVKMIFVDFHSTGGDKIEYREEMKKKAEELGLKDDVIFTSEFDESLNLESPRTLVADLFKLSNVFILPSMSETYSLIAQEALLSGNVMVLNHDFPAMRSIYKEHAIYRKFSSGIDIMSDVSESTGKTDTSYNNRKDYFSEIAKQIIARLKEQPYKAIDEFRKTRNIDYVFKNYIEPLINKE